MRYRYVPFFFALACAVFAQSIDGRIAEGEYPFSLSRKDQGYELFWRLEGDLAVFALRAETEGWLALGFDPETAMESADMIIGWVDDNGEVTVLDCFATGPYGPHPPDTELGGSADIIASAGEERAGVTTIEFSRKLAAQDRFDKDIPLTGVLKIVWAFGFTDDFQEIHAENGVGAIDVASGQAAGGGGISIRPDVFPHALLMFFSCLILYAAMFIARFRKRKKWWLKAHRVLAVGVAVMGAAGVGMALYMVARSSGIHIRSVHSVFGLATLTLMVTTPILGQAVLKVKKKQRIVRQIHRYSGRTTLALLLITIILGVLRALL